MRTKRFLAALLAAVMTFTCLGVVAFAAIPAGAQYNDNMDSYSSGWPTGITDKAGKNIPIAYDTGRTGESTDKAFRFLLGIGNGGGSYTTPDEANMNIGWANGATINLGGNSLKDTTVVFDMDFKVGAKSVWTIPFLPTFSGNKFPVTLQLREGELTINNVPQGTGSHTSVLGADYRNNIIKKLGTKDAKEWFNVGAVIQHSSTKSLEGGNALIIDIYVDSELVYTFKTNASDYASAALTSFMIPAVTTATSGSGGRYDGRNEYTYIDNLYIGDDVARATPDFLPLESKPANGSVVPVDADISLVMNQSIGNADQVTDSIYLTQKNGATVNFGNIVNETTYNEKDTLRGVLAESLYYSEEYTLKASSRLENTKDRKIDTSKMSYKFTTDTMFPVKAEITDYTKSTGTASAELALSGNTAAMKLVMAAYDEQGVMVDYTVEDIAANQSAATIEVSYSDNETIKIFAVDNFSAANLIMEPIIDGKKAKSYNQTGSTTVSVGEATTMQQVISVDGETDSVRGWVVTKIAKKGNETSANLDDYLSIDAVQADDNGKFSFAGRVKEASATYAYKATAPDSNNVASGEVEYTLGTGNELLSLTLGGKRATLRGNEYYLKLKNTDVRGLLVEFTVPYKAIVICNGEELVSGASRIDFTNNVTLVVRPEMGEEMVYNVFVDVQITDDYDDRNDNITYIIDENIVNEGDEIVDPGEWEDPTRVFTDVPKGYWAMEAIEALYEKGVVGGVGDGRFAPNQLITREEFASMVAKAFGFTPKNTRMVFEDVRTGAWYENSVYALAENGIVSGVEKYKFGVGQTITRQDMTVILYNVIKDSAVEDVREYKNFKDQAKISSYATEAVEFMYKAGFVNGFEDGTFRPFDGTTKAMAAYMIYSLIK